MKTVGHHLVADTRTFGGILFFFFFFWVKWRASEGIWAGQWSVLWFPCATGCCGNEVERELRRPMRKLLQARRGIGLMKWCWSWWRLWYSGHILKIAMVSFADRLDVRWKELEMCLGAGDCSCGERAYLGCTESCIHQHSIKWAWWSTPISQRQGGGEGKGSSRLGLQDGSAGKNISLGSLVTRLWFTEPMVKVENY